MALKVGELYSVLTLDDKAYQKGVNEAEKKFNELGKTSSFVTKAITASFAAAGASVAAGFGFAVKGAADFQQAMANVKSVAGSLSTGEMKQLQDLTLKVAAATKYNATETAKGMEELVKAGVSVKDIMDGGLKAALDLATAGELDLGDAAEIASTALNSFSKDGLTVERAANLLAGAANASATSVQEMKYSLSAVATVAAGVGLSMESTSTALAVFAQNGLKGQDAGTSLKSMLQNLIPQTKQQSQAMDELGLLTKAGGSAFFDASGKIKSMGEIADLMQSSMKGLTEEQRLQAMSTIFGSDAIRAANILFKEGAKGVQEMNKEMQKTTAASVAYDRMNTLKGSIDQVKGNIETLAVLIGTPFLDPMKTAADAVQKVLDKLSSDIMSKGLYPALRDLIPQDVMDKLNKLGGWVDSLQKKMQTGDWEAFGKQLGDGLRQMLDGIGDFGKQIGKIIIDSAKKVDWAEVGANAAEGMLGFILGLAKGLMDPMTWWHVIKENWDVILEVIVGIVALPESWIARLSVALAKIPFVGTFLSWLLKATKNLGDKVGDPIKKFLKEMWGYFTDGITQGIKKIDFFPALKQLFSSGAGALKNIGENLYLWAGQAAESLGKGLGNGVTFAKKGLALITHTIDDMLRAMIEGTMETGRFIVEGIWKGISGASGWLKDKVVSFAKSVGDTIRDFFGIHSPSRLMAEYGAYIAEGLAKGIKDNKDAPAGEALSMAELTRDAIVGALEKATQGLDADLGIGQATFDNLAATLGDNTADGAKKLNAQLTLLNLQLGASKDKAALLQDAYDRLVESGQGNSLQAKEIYKDLLNEGTAQANLTKEIDSTTKSLGNLAKDNALAQVTKTVETVRQSVGFAVDILKAKFDQLSATFGSDVLGQTLKLKAQADELSGELVAQKQIVATLEDAYKKLVETRGEDSTEAKQHLVYLEQERAKQSQLQRQLRDTTTELSKQSTAFADISKKMADADATYSSDMSKARDDYLAKVEQTNKRVADSEQQLTDQYDQQLQQRTQSLYGFTDLFGAVDNRKAYSQQLLVNLRGQVQTFTNWSDNIQRLSQRGIDDGLVKELREMGPKAAPELQALVNMTDDQLGEYVKLWKEKSSQAREEAVAEMTEQKSVMVQKIAELKTAAQTELAKYVTEWAVAQQQIKTNFNTTLNSLTQDLITMTQSMPALGAAIAQALAAGIAGGGTGAFQGVISQAQKEVDQAEKQSSVGLGDNGVGGTSANDTDARLRSDSAFRQSEMQRATQVIANRRAAGLDTALQESYVNKIKALPGMATGGSVKRSGLSWVGERGPELLNMPNGASIIPLDSGPLAGLSKLLDRLAGNLQPAGAGGIVVNVYDNVFKDGREAGDKIYAALRRLGV